MNPKPTKQREAKPTAKQIKDAVKLLVDNDMVVVKTNMRIFSVSNGDYVVDNNNNMGYCYSSFPDAYAKFLELTK